MNSNIFWDSAIATFYSFTWAALSALLLVPLSLGISILLQNNSFFRKVGSFIIELFVALPSQLLLLVLAGILGGSPWALILAMIITQVPHRVRHLGVHLERAYASLAIESAVALGVGRFSIFLKYVLPRLSMPLFLTTLTLFKQFILSESLLTFLGLSFDPLSPSLGRLISEGREYLFFDAARFWVPVLCLSGTLLTLQIVSDRFSSLFQVRGIRYL